MNAQKGRKKDRKTQGVTERRSRRVAWTRTKGAGPDC